MFLKMCQKPVLKMSWNKFPQNYFLIKACLRELKVTLNSLLQKFYIFSGTGEVFINGSRGQRALLLGQNQSASCLYNWCISDARFAVEMLLIVLLERHTDLSRR